LILLNCDKGPYGEKIKNEDLSKILNVGLHTIYRVKKIFVEDGFEAAVSRAMRESKRSYGRIIDGETEAHLITLSRNDPPEGHSKWSLRLLADKMVELKYVEEVSYETIRRTLKKRIKTLENQVLGNWECKKWAICCRHGEGAGSLQA
jgi:transposase